MQIFIYINVAIWVCRNNRNTCFTS